MALTSPIGLITFPHLFTPRAPTPGAEPRFSVAIILDQAAMAKPEWQAIRQAVLDCIKEKWGDSKAGDKNFIRSLRMPWRDSSEKAQYAGYTPGTMFFSAWTKQKPGVVDANKHDILVPSDVWAGQLGRANIAPFAYDNSGNKGVSFMLNHVQIVKQDMPRLDGRMNADQAFGDDLPPEYAAAAASRAPAGHGGPPNDLPF